MKYMGWSFDQLMSCPDRYISEIIDYADREKQEREESEREAERKASNRM